MDRTISRIEKKRISEEGIWKGDEDIWEGSDNMDVDPKG